MDWLTNPQMWIALFTLSTLEIVLGVDNLVFISIAVGRLPLDQHSRARRIGLALACLTRIALLIVLAHLARLDDTHARLFLMFGQIISIRDLIMIGGGVFLLVKGAMEIHDAIYSEPPAPPATGSATSFIFVIAQIALIDIVFSLDSVITAVGMVRNIPVMVAAIVLAVIVMLFASDPVGNFIDRNPTIRMLALVFIMLIGVTLIGEGVDIHIARGYIYFAMAFSAVVEILNLLAKRERRKRCQRRAEDSKSPPPLKRMIQRAGYVRDKCQAPSSNANVASLPLQVPNSELRKMFGIAGERRLSCWNRRSVCSLIAHGDTQMLKHLVIGLGALALTAALIDRNAFANGTFAVTLADYNSAQVAQNGGVVTYPTYSTVNGTFYNAAYTLTSGTKLETGSRLTITLPTGFTFNTQPSLFFFQFPEGDAILIAGGIGFQYATFQIQTAVTDTADTVILYPEFSVNTGAALASQFGGNSLPLSIQATNNVASTNNDASPVSQPAFTHAVGSLPDTITPGSGHINLASPYYGDQFVASGNTIADSGFVAVFQIYTETEDPFNSNATVLQPNGALNVLTPTDTTNITVEGYFNGILSAYADTNTGGVCQSAIPGGAYTGTVTNGSIIFSGVPINTPVQICIIPIGVMWANNFPYVYTYSAGAGVTDYFGGLAQTTANNFYTYDAAPTTVVEVLAGSPQHATVGTGFCTPLGVKVYDTSTTPAYPLAGIDVIFDAPNTGQSGSFAGSGNSILAGTNAEGIAISAFAANSTPGIYTATANVGTVQGVFGLTNEPGVSDQIFCNGFEY